jgi:hypothetical protein
MAAIEEATTISQEVRRGEVFGAVKLYNLDDPIKSESSAGRMLGIRGNSVGGVSGAGDEGERG